MALETGEKVFWEFCDDDRDLVKERAYDVEGGAATESAQATLAVALHTQLRLLAPFLPYVTEEAWSWWQDGSVHRAAWPTATELGSAASSTADLLDHVAAALGGLRGAKSRAKVKQRHPIARVEFTGPADMIASVQKARSEEHTSELQSLMRISYAVFCLKKKN